MTDPTFSIYGFDALRWIENTDAASLRFVGHADEVCRADYAHMHGIGHTGWFTEDDGINGETLRGGVWQLPGKNGKARYVPGYSDPNIDGAALLALGDIVTGERGDFSNWETDEGARDAAMRADQLAERAAEAEREYQRAWRAGCDAADALEEASGTRRELIEALAEHRKVKHVEAPALCRVFKSWVSEQVAFIRDRQDLARSRADDFDHMPGFADAMADR